MKRIYQYFLSFKSLGKPSETDKTDLNRMLNGFLGVLFLLSVVLWVIIFCLTYKANALAHLTFLGVASACLLSGIALGFLFGIPRAEKFRYKADSDHNANASFYSDNTNLEDISDWLTKIIVGLTLVKFNTILSWLNHSALSMGATLSGQPPCTANCTGYFVFSYAIIILYFVAGLGVSYLWTRIYFMLILVVSKKSQEKILREEIIKKQAIANPELTETSLAGVSSENREGLELQKGNFMDNVKEKYKKALIIDKTDLQKSRWGAKETNNGYKLSASVDAARSFLGLYKVILSVTATEDKIPVAGKLVAFFLHDSFPREIVFVEIQNGNATLEITAYESFTAGAMLEDGTTLELDLNNVPGYPRDFYWGK